MALMKLKKKWKERMKTVSTEHGVLQFTAEELDLGDLKSLIDLNSFITPLRGRLQKDNSAETNVDTNARDVTVYPVAELMNHYSVKTVPHLNYEGAMRKKGYEQLLKPINYIKNEANKVFNYDLWEFEHNNSNESPQLLRYEAPSSGYDWHHDLGNGNAAQRKISISIFLNDDYEGGEFCLFDKGEVIAPSKAGTAIAFSSFIPHRVKPITKGIRWSLVSWIAGPEFK
jgi:hypothetical protein